MSSEVDLGLLSECESWLLSSKYFPSKVGGKPAWLSLKDLPSSESLQCDLCKEPTVFLCQVYAPIEDKDECFHRTIFTFICTNGLCCKPNSAGNLKVFRSQLPRYNDFYSPDPPEEIEGEDSTLSSIPLLCFVCGSSGRFQCGGCHIFRYCSKSHQIIHWKKGHKALCKSFKEKSINTPDLHSDDLLTGILLREWGLDIEEEPKVKSSSANETEDLQRRLNEFKHLEESNAIGTMPNIPETELENYSNSEDKAFRKFSKRVSLNSEQVLRFQRDGQPLWISEHNILEKNNVPPCEYCKGPRIFEFQIMPQLLNSINVASSASSIDWGVLCVYTCKNSCDDGVAYKQEFIYKQDIQITQ
uniref:Putative programmed cell death protein n=1 Tax=Xenopsylla cheopis TaxID=163159 RepID=A0A6M2DPR9_XENCH